MTNKNFLKLLNKSLPQDISLELIKIITDKYLPNLSYREACIHALKDYQELDWVRYISENEDVKKENLDPVIHFIDDGIFEGRILYQKLKDNISPKKSNIQPFVSIIIPNFNNALYLNKSIGSLISQTLKNIEIIIIDDNSTDESIQIIDQIAVKDSRIKVIKFSERKSQHMARKVGVLASNGKYIMFLDPDDYFSPYACEIAYKTINDKYDFVCFNTNVIFLDDVNNKTKSNFINYLNKGVEREYTHKEIMPAIYQKYQINELLWNKIYKSSICKDAFSLMEDGYIPRGQDNYEAMSIVSLAKSALKINDYLYNYRKGQGVSTSIASQDSINAFATASKVYAYMRKSMHKSGNIQYMDFWTEAFIKQSLSAWLKYTNETNCYNYFNEMANNYGIIELLDHIMINHSLDWEKVADKFKFFGPGKRSSKEIKSIGILYTVMGNGGAERVTWELAPLLLNSGYNVTVFLETAHENDRRFKLPVKVIYLGGDSGQARKKSLLQGLANALIQNPVDVMLCHACYDKSILWYIMLLKYFGIGVFIFPHSAFFRRIMQPDAYIEQAHPAILRCADKVPVLSHFEEIYYHLQDVNAEYVPNPVRLPDKNWESEIDFDKRKYNLIVFGRLGEPNKQALECLKILSEAKKIIPNLKMTFIGSFVDKNIENNFYATVEKYNLNKNIHVTGWIEEPYEYIDNASILVSAAWHEAFPLSISECQGRGIPVVMYDLPIEIAINNESIIKVPHNNTKLAAKSICNLINDKNKWHKLSKIARKKSSLYSSNFYINKVQNILSNFDKFSNLHPINIDDYNIILKTLAFYGMHLPPWIIK